jgi:hypothetical protein
LAFTIKNYLQDALKVVTLITTFHDEIFLTGSLVC